MEILDLSEIHRHIANNEEAIKRLSEIGREQYYIDDFLRDFKLERKLQNTRYYPFTVYSKEILEFQRNGLGIPQIPGSSIKGSIRSAYAYSLFSGLDQGEQRRLLEGINSKGRDKLANQGIERKLFGKDSMLDLFKALTITDASCQEDDLNVGITKILSLSQYGGWHWKRRNRENDMEIPVEFLRPGTRCETTIRFNNFFISDPNAKKILHLDRKLYPN